MNALPIVRRELLVLSRRRWFYWLRSGVGCAIALVSCIVFAVTWNVATKQGLGAPLFYTVTFMSYLVSVLAGPVLLSDCIAEEKVAGTLGLLFLTNTRSHDIVGGKFIALAMPAIHCLLAAIPIMGIAFALGGVTGEEFLRSTAALLNTLFFSLAGTIFCSALASSGRQAFGFSLVLVLGCCGGMTAILLTWPKAAFTSFWLPRMLASPGLAFWNAPDAVYSANPSAFANAIGISHGLGWALLAGAMLRLPFCWRDQPREANSEASYEKCARATKQRMTDPLTWLARRRLGGTMAAWILAGASVLVIGGFYLATGQGRIDGMAVVFAAYALHGVFKVWVAWVSSRAFGTERDSGALELLLVTPLGETAIWRAWLNGLRQRFLIPALALVAFDLLLAWNAAANAAGGFGEVSIFFLTMLAALIFLMDCYTLTWTGLWSGLVARNATRACVRTLMFTLIIPGAFFLNAAIAASVTGMLTPGSLIVFALSWFIVSFLLDLILGALAMVRLSHDCREAVVNRS